MTIHRYLASPLLAFSFLTAACAGNDPDAAAGGEAPVTDAQTAADPAMEQSSACINREEGFTVRYPDGWHVHPASLAGGCALFDPDPIEIPRGSEFPLDFAIHIDIESVPVETLTGEMMGRRTLSQEQTTVAGREAVRILGEETGEGLHDRGIRSYRYVVDLEETVFIGSTYSVGKLPFDRKRRILDDMMASIDFAAR